MNFTLGSLLLVLDPRLLQEVFSRVGTPQNNSKSLSLRSVGSTHPTVIDIGARSELLLVLDPLLLGEVGAFLSKT